MLLPPHETPSVPCEPLRPACQGKVTVHVPLLVANIVVDITHLTLLSLSLPGTLSRVYGWTRRQARMRARTCACTAHLRVIKN